MTTSRMAPHCASPSTWRWRGEGGSRSTTATSALAEQADRPIVRRLLQLAERHDIPMTWAVVGRIFDDSPGFANLKGPREAWFAPELVEAIQTEPGPPTTSGPIPTRTSTTTSSSEAEASLDLGHDVELRKRWGIPARSWVFPRNGIAYVEKLAEAGVEVYRTLDAGWIEQVRASRLRLYPAGNLLDKILPITPPLVELRGPDLRRAPRGRAAFVHDPARAQRPEAPRASGGVEAALDPAPSRAP